MFKIGDEVLDKFGHVFMITGIKATMHYEITDETGIPYVIEEQRLIKATPFAKESLNKMTENIGKLEATLVEIKHCQQRLFDVLQQI